MLANNLRDGRKNVLELIHKVTENNYGEEAQVIYAYDVMTNGKTDATTLFTVTFE